MLFQQTAILGFCAALALCNAASAAGWETPNHASVVVKTGDLDLATRDGAQLMALRIRNAAAEACGREYLPVAARISDGFIRCRESAVDRAEAGLSAALAAEALLREP